MKKLHESAAGTDEDEDITVLYFTLHPFMHQTAQRTDALAHIRPAGTQEVAHCIVQTKHDRCEDFDPVLPSTIPQTHYRNGREARRETVMLRHEGMALQMKSPQLPA